MQYTGKNLEEAIKLAAETEYCSVEDIEYYVVNESEENVTIEVFTIMDVIEFAQTYVREGINSLGFDAKVTPALKEGVINLNNTYNEEINEDVYYAYNVFSYGKPHKVQDKNQRWKNSKYGYWTKNGGKYNGSGTRGEYYILGRSYSGALIYNYYFFFF